MGVLVDHFCGFAEIFDILEIVQCLIVALFRQIMDDNHLNIALLIGEIDQILNPPMRHHNKIDKILINDIQIILQNFLQISLLLPQLILRFDPPLTFVIAFLAFKIVQIVDNELDEPGDEQASLGFLFGFQFLEPGV